MKIIFQVSGGIGKSVAATGSVIACGGQENFIGQDSFFSFIGGGQKNSIAAGTNHSSIFSGHNNQVSGSYSSILGGSGNNDNGNSYVGIFGQNVTGVIPNAFHAENYVAQNIPLYSGIGPIPVPVGSKAMYYTVVGTQCQVFIG